MKNVLKINNIMTLGCFLLSAFFIYKIAYAIGKAIAHLIK
ncbi:Uncharacterised protein [Clostridium tertium]|uniref:Uncharacterized protein n=1 Tax=Clostridium tertium TaxID=1559 RepID=A0A6N3G2K8_9CLOT